MIFQAKSWRIRKSLLGVFGLSMVLHIAVVLGFGGAVVYKLYRRPPVTFQTPPPPSNRLEPRKLEMNVRATDLSKSSGRPRVKPRLTAVGHASEIALPALKIDARAVDRKISGSLASMGGSGFGSGIGGGYGTGIGGGMGGMGMATIRAAALQSLAPPAMLANRCSQLTRNARLAELGGTPECEATVMRGLKWLKQSQNADGSWGNVHQSAMTGLALLAFMGHCETPGSADFGKTVEAAINYLVNVGETHDGRLTPERGNTYPYSHGIATYALAEAYSLTHMSKLAPVVEKAAKIIIDGQSPGGGWEYDYNKSGHDTSVTGWQIQALKATHLGGLKPEGLEKAMDAAVANLRHQQAGNGAFSYKNNANHRWSLTGVGVLGLSIWKPAGGDEIRKGLNFIHTVDKLDYHGGDCDLYGWYYNTLGCFMNGGGAWSKWNRKFRDQLVRNQAGDGSWPTEGGGKTDSYAKGDGKYFRGTLCILMLEIYYRFLPTTR